METSALFHGNFFDISLNIVSGVLLHSEIIKQRAYFSPAHSSAKNLHNADFELHANPGDANTQCFLRLSGTAHMLLHKRRNTIWCALSCQDGGGGVCGPLGSKNTAARWRLQSGLLLMQHMAHKFRRYAHDKYDKAWAPAPGGGTGVRVPPDFFKSFFLNN